MKNLIKNKKGFTIIEVMIVLAVAGVIMLIVLLAVPALQRNQRNTQRKNDVTALLGGVTEFESNNNGVLPTGATYANSTVTLTGPAGTTNTNVKVGYFTSGIGAGAGQVSVLAAYAATGPFNTNVNDRVVIDPAASCNGNASQAGSARQTVAIYELETGSNAYTGYCQES